MLEAHHNNAAAWESKYRAGDHPWDRGGAPPGLEQWVRDQEPAGAVLVPGCGLGHDAARLADLGLEVLGLDLSATAVDRARTRYAQAGLAFQVGDVLDLDPQHAGAFDAVWEHTCFCALHPRHRERYADALTRALRPGGQLAGLFFVCQGPEPPDGPPFHVPMTELHRVFDPGFTLVQAGPPTAHLSGREGLEQLLVWNRKPQPGDPP